MAMEKKYLIINTGSTSKKYKLYSDRKEILRLHLVNKGLAHLKLNDREETEKITTKQDEQSIEYLIEKAKKYSIIKTEKEIQKIGIRIVAPGIYFTKTKQIDRNYIIKLKKAAKIAPLHILPVLNEIKNINNALRKIKMIGISDSEFHNTMPEVSRIYAVPESIAKKFEIYRYGYHGIALESALNKIKQELGKIPEKMIICHLGGGASITAIKNGWKILRAVIPNLFRNPIGS